MRTLLSWLPIFAGLAAAAAWAISASITVPTNIGSGFGALVGVEEMSAGFKMVALWNRLAAAVAAIASLLQALNIKPGSPP
jgi:hypothetical protein